jgi:hypothetical protein
MVSRGKAKFRDKWVAEAVIPNQDIGNATKVLLLAMATRMTDAGHLAGVTRQEFADWLGVDPSRIPACIREAKHAGLLTLYARGHPGRTSEYDAHWESRKGSGEHHPNQRRKRSGQHHPNLGMGAGEHHPRIATHSPGEADRKGSAERTPNARMTTESRRRNGRVRHFGGYCTSGETKDGADERVGSDSSLDAVSRTPPPAPANLTDVDTSSAASAAVLVPGNPRCQVCGKPNLYAPASIARGVCARCVKLGKVAS